MRRKIPDIIQKVFDNVKKELLNRVSGIIALAVVALVGGAVGYLAKGVDGYIRFDNRVRAVEDSITQVDELSTEIQETNRLLEQHIQMSQQTNANRDRIDSELTSKIDKVDQKLDELKNILIETR